MVEGEWIKVRNKHQDLGKSRLACSTETCQRILQYPSQVEQQLVWELNQTRSGRSGIYGAVGMGSAVQQPRKFC
jgi:hypothetical protein